MEVGRYKSICEHYCMSFKRNSESVWQVTRVVLKIYVSLISPLYSGRYALLYQQSILKSQCRLFFSKITNNPTKTDHIVICSELAEGNEK